MFGLGKIIQLIIGLDCIVQRAELRITEGNKRANIMSRPIQNLHQLEMKRMSMPLSN